MREISTIYCVHTSKASGFEQRYKVFDIGTVAKYATGTAAVESNPEFHRRFTVGCCIVTILVEEV